VSQTSSLAALLTDGDADDVVAYAHGAPTTRETLRTLAGEIAASLTDAECSGCAVGVLAPNESETIAAWFGVWGASAAFVPLNPRAPAAELGRAIETTGLQAVVAWRDLADRVAHDTLTELPGSPFVVLRLSPLQPRAVLLDDAIIQFTSGTTGAPKAVPLRHDTVTELLDTVIRSLRGSQPGQRARMPNLVPMSLSSWAGIYQVLFAFKLSVPVVLMARFEPREFARLVREYGIKSSVLPPAALLMLMQEPAITTLEPLRYVRCVSAPLSPAHARKFHERFGIAILNGYGQTELGGEAVGWSAADWKRYGLEKLGSVGRPHAAFRLRVRREDGDLAATDEIGELEIASESALPADSAIEARVTSDGWLRTGDLARIDADRFVWIEGRVSAMINRGGLKVFPDEVEERLRAHPTVLDVAVTGVADDRLGEVPWAFVVPSPGASVRTDELRAWCRETLAPYKVPAGFTTVDDLPRNETGKVLRHELPDPGSGGPGSEDVSTT
jgi:long-chain acyl-CoA synthetase